LIKIIISLITCKDRTACQFLGGVGCVTLILPLGWYTSGSSWRLQQPPRKTSDSACLIWPQASIYSKIRQPNGSYLLGVQKFTKFTVWFDTIHSCHGSVRFRYSKKKEMPEKFPWFHFLNYIFI